MSSRVLVYLISTLSLVSFGSSKCSQSAGPYYNQRIIACPNISSISDIDFDYNYGVGYDLIIQDSNIETIEASSFTKLATIELMEALHLGGNFIKTLKPNAFKNLSKLTALYLNDNLLEEVIRAVFNFLDNLRILDLRNNFILKIEDHSFMGLNSLDHLLLAQNVIQEIRNETFQMTSRHFDTLDLSHNSLSHLPNNLESQVLNLDLSFNKFKILDFEFSTEIKTLDLSGNQLSSIKETLFSNLKHLHFLKLSQNVLSNISNVLFQDLSDLNSLNLSHNQISNLYFGTFDSLEKLEILDLSHNNLKQLHQYTFASMASLQKLYFDYNQISHFDVTDLKSHLPKLTFVSLEGNLWECKELAIIYHVFKSNGVVVKKGNYFDSENFRGIACDVKNLDSVEEKIAEIAEVVNDTLPKIVVIAVLNAMVLVLIIFALIITAYFFYKKLNVPKSALLQMELS